MTNFEYIKNNLTDRDLAYYAFPSAMKYNDRPPLFTDRIYDAWMNWAESFSSNHGNMAKGNHNGHIIRDNPSIWAWQKWHYPDGNWRDSGRTNVVSFSVWLGMQYNPDEWVNRD